MTDASAKVAICLSGGGNRDALQVGAVKALFEHGIEPDILVGSSAGAMNAAFIATDPTPDGVQRLGALWRDAAGANLFPGNIVTQALRFLRGYDSLYPSDNLRRFVENNLPPGFRRFGDITAVDLRITAGDLATGTLYLFGPDPDLDIVDGVMASSALPGIFPPVQMNGLMLVDGGTWPRTEVQREDNGRQWSTRGSRSPDSRCYSGDRIGRESVRRPSGGPN